MKYFDVRNQSVCVFYLLKNNKNSTYLIYLQSNGLRRLFIGEIDFSES